MVETGHGKAKGSETNGVPTLELSFVMSMNRKRVDVTVVKKNCGCVYVCVSVT